MAIDEPKAKTPQDWLREWAAHIAAPSLKGDTLAIEIECEVAAEALMPDIASGKLAVSKAAIELTKAAEASGLPDAAGFVYGLFNLEPPKNRRRKREKVVVPVGEGELERDEIGRIVRSERNILTAFAKAKITLSYDEFAMEYRVAGLDGYGPDLSKQAREELFLLLQRDYRFKPSWDDCRMVVDSAARRNRFHPVRRYLDGLIWDEHDRIDDWLIRYAGAPDTPFVRAVGRIMLIAAVRRIRKPGCKFDEMLVLESPEGRNKSTLFAVLASEPWFADDAPLTASAREVIERLRGRWIVECADLSGMTRADIEHLKAFMSRREDAASLKYDPDTTKQKRSCIFVGTTNRKAYLISDTGNRRFWPVEIDHIDIDAIARDRDQLWAEAAYWERQGESIRLDPELYAAAQAEQEARRILDPWREKLAGVLADVEGKLRCEDAWRIIDKPVAQRAQHDNTRLGSAMRDLGWERRQVKIAGRKAWAYVKGSPPYDRIELWKDGNHFEAKQRGDDLLDDET